MDLAFEHVGPRPRRARGIDPRFLRPAEVEHLIGDYSKARAKLGWEPQTSFEEMVRLMVDADLELLARACPRSKPGEAVSQPPAEVDVAVVGAGILGLAVARELRPRHPGLWIAVLEGEDRVGTQQTGHNSGVVHAGIYYAPGSLKARLCVAGAARAVPYCEEHGMPTSAAAS